MSYAEYGKVTMPQIMQILKPVPTCNFMDMCSSYVKEINAHDYSDCCYEISGLNTKSGNPWTWE